MIGKVITKIFSAHAKRLALALLGSLQLTAGAAFAQSANKPDGTDKTPSVTFSAGEIFSKHLDNTNRKYNQQHHFLSATFSSGGRGTWGVYMLTPNSLSRPAVGLTYALAPYKANLGHHVQGELAFGGGLSTGYYLPVSPTIFSTAALVLHKGQNVEWLLTSMVMPYPAYNERLHKEEKDGKVVTYSTGVFKSVGLVVTSPALTIRYKFK